MIVFCLRTPFYDDIQVITVAHDVYKHGTSHHPMATFLIHNSRIVDEDYRMDLAIREETQIHLSDLHHFP